jgi:glycosyltransferase involved in cell wall biosynthesis
LSLDSPKVTVLMSVYNGEAYLGEAIESILHQTFRDFEFIVIDDGSTDGTAAILAHYQSMDDRIHVYPQDNQGLITSLNRGCRLGKGKYIARMDADDVSLPERLSKQIDYMEAHPEIGVLGTWVDFIDGNSHIVGNWHMATVPGVIGWSLFFGSPLAHSSIMIRRPIIEQLGFYRPEALHAEDYDLWARASFVTRIANIPEVLLLFRFSQENISTRYSKTQEQTSVKIMHWTITQLLASEVSVDTVANLHSTSRGVSIDNLEQIQQLAIIIQRLHKAYIGTHSLNRLEHSEVSRDASIRLCTLAVLARQVSLRKGFAIFMEALKIYPQLLFSRQIITKGANIGLARNRTV